MFGTIGTPEMIVIFLLALLLFGPKELPQLGRKLGRAMTEFRRASNELKSTFDREMQNLEAETNLSGVGQEIEQHLDTYNYDYSSYEHTNYDATYNGELCEGSVATTPTESESATQDAELPSAATPEGVIARGSEAQVPQGPEDQPSEHPAPATAEHNA